MKTNKALLGVLFSGLFSLAIGTATGIPAVGIFVAILVLSFFTKAPELSLMTAIDTTELAAALGDYYRENRDILNTQMLLDPTLSDKFTIYDDVTDELPLPNLEVANIIKPGVVKTFSGTSDALAFDAEILKVRDIKYDLFVVPTDLHKQWLAYKRSNRRADGSHDPFELPFEQFIMEHIMKAARNQLYLSAIFNGTYNAGGSTPASTMTGYATLVTSLIAAEVATPGTGIVPVSVADPTSSNIIDIVEATYDGLDEAYKNVPTQMFANPTLFNYYVRKYRTDYGGNTDYDGMKSGRVTIDGTMCELVREPGLGTSNRLICGPKSNFAYGCDTAATAVMDIQKFDRGLKILGDFKAGVQFNFITKALSVNELVSDGIV